MFVPTDTYHATDTLTCIVGLKFCKEQVRFTPHSTGRHVHFTFFLRETHPEVVAPILLSEVGRAAREQR